MNLIKIIIVIICVSPLISQAQTKFKGLYNNRNIYIQNRTQEKTTLECIDSITVNGSKYVDNRLYQNFEIKLDSIGIKELDEFVVIIYNKLNCNFIILNPESFKAPNSRSNRNNQMTYDKHTKFVSFNFLTEYKIYDQYGNLILSGEKKTVDLSSLSIGLYRVVFDENIKQILR